MSNKRITDLTELTNPTTDDVFPVVDIATNTTTKVQLGNLPVPSSVTTALATKQDSLVSGTNIKTINSTSVLGSGNIAVQETLVSGTNIKTLNNTSLLGSGNIVLTANPSGVAGAIQFSNGSAFASDAANFFWDDTNNRLGVGTNAPISPLNIQSDTTNVGILSVTTSGGGSNRLEVWNSNSVSTPVWNIGLPIPDTRISMFSNVTLRANGTNAAVFDSNQASFGSISGARLGIRGTGSTSATTSLLVQNSAGTQLLSIGDGGLSVFNGTVQNTTGPMQALSFAPLTTPFQFGTASIYNITGTAPVVTSGQRDGFLGQFTFAPTSGTAVLNVMNASPTINQTGGANGITRGLFIDPTLTAAADFRAIEVTNGNVLIGNSASNTAKLSIKGSGSTSATTSLLVQNSSGTELIKVADNGDLTTIDINARTIFAKASTLELRGNSSGSASSASLQGFVSGLGWLNMFTAESGKDFGQIPRGAVVNGTTIDASAIFQVNSTTKGFLPPRMTTTQKNAIASPAAGLILYDSTTNKLQCYNGSTWNDLF